LKGKVGFAPLDNKERGTGRRICFMVINSLLSGAAMKLRAACWLAFMLLAVTISAQTSNDVSPKQCLRTLSLDKLVACFDDWKICQQGDWDIANEIVRRGAVSQVLRQYWNEPKFMARNGIEKAAYQVDSPEVTEFMRRIVAEKIEDGEDDYFPVNYLAKQCDPQALEKLSTGVYRDQGSLQYQTSVELFGKCKFHPAIPYLVGTALHDMSFNIVAAAEDSLHKLYPDAPKNFRQLADMQKYFCDRAHQEGFKVKCDYDY
jgi:hypothetical protein